MSGWAGFFIAAAALIIVFDGKPSIKEAIVQNLTHECVASGTPK